MWREPLETFPAEAWDAVLDLNLKSPFWLVQALLPALRRAGSADDPARIINIGSIAAIHVAEAPNYSYASSKAALHQLTRVLGPQHITVNAVAPGVFPSHMMVATIDAIGDKIAAKTPLRRLGRDDDMAGVAVFLASRAGSYLTGAVTPVDGSTTHRTRPQGPPHSSPTEPALQAPSQSTAALPPPQQAPRRHISSPAEPRPT
ncbi:short-chain dehydrogenase/reductase SDR [Streptomyces sp. AA4]|nr:short-chain dehydrogenase/reductase SDR [Streptomyces sp. AA4]